MIEMARKRLSLIGIVGGCALATAGLVYYLFNNSDDAQRRNSERPGIVREDRPGRGNQDVFDEAKAKQSELERAIRNAPEIKLDNEGDDNVKIAVRYIKEKYPYADIEEIDHISQDKILEKLNDEEKIILQYVKDNIRSFIVRRDGKTFSYILEIKNGKVLENPRSEKEISEDDAEFDRIVEKVLMETKAFEDPANETFDDAMINVYRESADHVGLRGAAISELMDRISGAVYARVLLDPEFNGNYPNDKDTFMILTRRARGGQLSKGTKELSNGVIEAEGRNIPEPVEAAVIWADGKGTQVFNYMKGEDGSLRLRAGGTKGDKGRTPREFFEQYAESKPLIVVERGEDGQFKNLDGFWKKLSIEKFFKSRDLEFNLNAGAEYILSSADPGEIIDVQVSRADNTGRVKFKNIATNDIGYFVRERVSGKEVVSPIMLDEDGVTIHTLTTGNHLDGAANTKNYEITPQIADFNTGFEGTYQVVGWENGKFSKVLMSNVNANGKGNLEVQLKDGAYVLLHKETREKGVLTGSVPIGVALTAGIEGNYGIPERRSDLKGRNR
jgi:hypothetical protein